MFKQSRQQTKEKVIKTWVHARTTSEKNNMELDGCQFGRLRYGFPCTAANFLVTLTTVEKIMCLRRLFKKMINLKLLTPKGGGK